MTEPENTDVITEAVAPPVEETPPAYHEEQQVEAPQQTGQSDKEINFAAMRERQDALERRLSEKDEQIDALRGQVQQPQAQPEPVEEVDDLSGIASDEWVTREQSEKLNQRYTQEAVQKALAAERQRLAEEKLPERIKDFKKEHKDFDQVVSKENVEYLKAHKPYLAQTLAATQDPIEQAQATYDLIKTYCPSAEVTQDKQQAEKNALRPGTLDAVGPARTADFDPKRINSDTKAQLWKEMQAAARG